MGAAFQLSGHFNVYHTLLSLLVVDMPKIGSTRHALCLPIFSNLFIFFLQREKKDQQPARHLL